MFTSTGKWDPVVTMPAPTIPIFKLSSLMQVSRFPRMCHCGEREHELYQRRSGAIRRRSPCTLAGVDEVFGSGLPQMRKLRVAIVAPSLRILGGQAVQAQRLLDAWADDPDVDAWLVPVNPAPPAAAPFLKIKYVRTVATQLMYWPLLIRELRKADVVHVFSAAYSSFLLAPLPAMRIARMLGRPVLLNYRSGEAPDHLKRSAVAREAIARVDRSIVPSRFLVDVFASFGLDATAIPNVVDLERFAFRDRFPLRPRILSTRNFESLYNVSCTLRAFKLVQKSWPNASLTLVGGGGEERKLRELAAELGLQHVEFVGRVPPDKIHEYYAAADLYVQTPNIDNMPTSVLEAYASGLPVVATEAGGVPAILTHGQTGLLAPLDDHLAVASRILLLLEQPGVARDLAHNAFAMCQSFTWPQVREQWLTHYRQLAESRAVRFVERVEAAE
jgi:glycosyltransferase involved in cell wall biosynthesis